MFNYFIRRFLLIIPTFLACTIVVFVILEITPGGPFEMKMMEAQQAQMNGEAGGSGGSRGSQEIPEESKAELKRYFGLDKPLPVRYVIWLGKILRGDLGE